jgi:hypothetical protein
MRHRLGIDLLLSSPVDKLGGSTLIQISLCRKPIGGDLVVSQFEYYLD